MPVPDGAAIGSLIKYGRLKAEEEEGLKNRYTFAGAEFFEKMKAENLYTLDREVIEKRIARYGLSGIYDKNLL